MTTALHAGLIGCGAIGRTHALALQEIGRMPMVAFCDASAERASAMCNEFGGDLATSDPTEVIGRPDIDAIYICTWHDTHAPLAIAALRAGKHVLAEKPLALTVDECVAVGEAVRESGSKLMTGFKMRYYDMLAKAKDLIPSPVLVTMQMMDNPWPDDFWASDPIKGGGNVLSQGCHSCDILRYVAGSDPVEVYATGANYHTATGVIDNVAASFRFENGVAANWVQGDAGCPPFTSKFFMQMFGQGESITLSDRLCTLTHTKVGEEPVTYSGSETGFLEENRAFVECLENGEPAPIDHADGLMATLMVLQSFASIRSGHPEPIAALVQR